MTIFRGPGGTGSATSDSDTTEFQEFLVQSQAARDAAQAAQAAAEAAEAGAEAAAGDVDAGVAASAASATAAAGSASSAATSATAAATSASGAATSATSAASSASSASTSASSASTSATNAGNSATAAATSATDALASATSSLIAVTHFGATPPSSPVAGKRWVNTNDGREYIYLNDGDSSQWVELSGPTSTFADASNVRYLQSGTNAVARTVDTKIKEVLSVTDFGAIGDWNGVTGTDNLAAFDACFAHALTLMAGGFGVKIRVPSGRYRLSGEWNVYRSASPRRDLIIEGEDQLASILVADFSGADKAVIRCVDPAKASRVSPTSVFKLGFSKSSSASPCPVYLDILGHGESRVEEVRFGSCDNTVMRIGSAQNVRMSDIVSFYGGKHFNYKATEGITFTTASGGVTITASSSIFSAADVGKIISLYPSATENYIKYTISAYTSPTQVTVSGTTLAATSVVGRFQPAQCSMTIGSNVLTANASCFTTADVGRVIYIRRAREGAWGDALLRATITAYTSPTTVTLSKNAERTITDEFFGVPVIDLYRPDGSGVVSAAPNDVKIDLLHIENFAGIGLVAQDVLFHHITKFKIHGEVSVLDTFASLGMMWLDDFAGELTGEFDGVCPGDSRLYACNFNDMSTINWLATRRQRQETIFKTEFFADPGGYINVSNLNTYTADPTGTAGLGVDANYMVNIADPRLVFSGFINMLGDSQKARYHVGREAYFSPQGQLKPFKNIDDSVLDPSNVSWNGTAPSGTQTLRYRWEQISNVVHFSIRLEYTLAGTSNSSVIVQLPSNMPAPKDLFGGAGSELAAGVVTAAMSTAASGVVPVLTKNYMQGSGSGGFQVVCALNSSTVNAQFATISGFYWAT